MDSEGPRDPLRSGLRVVLMATGLCALLGGLWSGLLILVLQTG